MALTALLDANVLWSAAVRDTLLRAADHDLFRPLWTAEILDEVARSLKRRRTDLDPARIDRTMAVIRAHFPDALVESYESLIPSMQTNVKDRHVLAAAVCGRAQILVTENVRHFPATACNAFNIGVETTDEFLCHLWSLDPDAVADVIREQAAALKNPPQTPLDVIATLARSASEFAALARTALEQP